METHQGKETNDRGLDGGVTITSVLGKHNEREDLGQKTDGGPDQEVAQLAPPHVILLKLDQLFQALPFFAFALVASEHGFDQGQTGPGAFLGQRHDHDPDHGADAHQHDFDHVVDAHDRPHQRGNDRHTDAEAEPHRHGEGMLDLTVVPDREDLAKVSKGLDSQIAWNQSGRSPGAGELQITVVAQTDVLELLARAGGDDRERGHEGGGIKDKLTDFHCAVAFRSGEGEVVGHGRHVVVLRAAEIPARVLFELSQFISGLLVPLTRVVRQLVAHFRLLCARTETIAFGIVGVTAFNFIAVVVSRRRREWVARHFWGQWKRGWVRDYRGSGEGVWIHIVSEKKNQLASNL